jgi:tRNA G10  N-methylase Trm11
MKFEFNASKENYEHFAAGRVLLSQAGMTSFPVRLASEIFQQAKALIGKEKLRVYDPCCGSAYLLSTLGFLHHEAIEALYGSDIRMDALLLAKKNLAMLSREGLLARRETIQALYEQYGKDSHREALESCDVLLESLPRAPIETGLWLGDATAQSLGAETVDLLICDVPYGDKVHWEGKADEPIFQLLEAHSQSLANNALLVLVSDKGQKAAHSAYQRVQQATHGKRRITMLRAVPSA